MGVVDIYAGAGIDKPDISIIDDDFARRFPTKPHPNLEIELLKRLLASELKSIERYCPTNQPGGSTGLRIQPLANSYLRQGVMHPDGRLTYHLLPPINAWKVSVTGLSAPRPGGRIGSPRRPPVTAMVIIVDDAKATVESARGE